MGKKGNKAGGAQLVSVKGSPKVNKFKANKIAGKATANSSLKVSNKMKSKGKKKTEKATNEKEDKVKRPEDALRSAVFALGGDEEDLELIEGVDKEDEEDEEMEEGNGKSKESFSAQARKELEALYKKLGLDQKFKNQVQEEESEAEENDAASESELEDDVTPQPPLKMNLQVGEVSSTTLEHEDEVGHNETAPKSEYHFLKEKPVRKHCIVKSSQKWHEILPDNEESTYQISDYWLVKLEKYATMVLEMEISNFWQQSQKGAKKSEMTYINTVLKSGALNDKISAYTVLLQDSPVQNLQALETLLGMVSLKSRRPCLLALETLTDLFANSLLAPDRKLKQFREHQFHQLQQLSGGNKDTRDRYLVLWLFEHKLKELYLRFLTAIDGVAKDTIEKTKIKAMSTILDLLIANPENEQELLSRLVNKLGDPVRSVAAKAMYQLGKLLEEHPAMKMVVLKEVERVLYRPNVSPKAQYYGVCFLSQILLQEGEEELALANRLIQIYFSFFKANVKKGDIDSKLMSALLTGVNRAFPYAKLAKDRLDDQIQVMFRLVQLCPFNTSVQALMLLYQIMDSGNVATDRFYSSLYRKLASPDLGASSKLAMFLNLLFKAMKKDSLVSRVLAFVKRLLQACQFLPPSVACASLFLISEIVRFRSDLGSLQKFFKQSGCTDITKFNDDDDEDEHYEDVKEEVKDEIKMEWEGSDAEEGDTDIKEESNKGISSWLHKDNLKGRHRSRGTLDGSSYNPFHRNPTFAGAETSILYELDMLCSHFHPSVALFAQNIVSGSGIKYSGDPLQDFTLIRFLDRFVFRNPKKDPLKGKPTTVLSKRKLYLPKGAKALAPDSKDYINRDEASVPADERFIFKYFRDKREKTAEDQDSDAESVTSEDFNDFLDKLSGAKTAGDDDDDDEIDFAGNAGDPADFEQDSEGEDDVDEGGSSEGEGEPELDEEDDDDDDLDLEDIKDLGSDEDDELDEEGFEGSEDEEDTTGQKQLKRKSGKAMPDFVPQGKRSKLKLSKVSGGDLHSLLASAEEFADLVDQSAANDLDLGGSGSMSNVKDKASKKQLKWEKARNERMEGGGAWKKNKSKARR